MTPVECVFVAGVLCTVGGAITASLSALNERWGLFLLGAAAIGWGLPGALFAGAWIMTR